MGSLERVSAFVVKQEDEERQDAQTEAQNHEAGKLLAPKGGPSIRLLCAA